MKNSVQLIGKCSDISNCEYAKEFKDEYLTLSTQCVYYESGLCTNEEAIIDYLFEKITYYQKDKNRRFL